MDSLPAAGDVPQESAIVTKSNRASRKTGSHRYDLDDIAERMEIISPNDIELVKFLGAGGYGEVRLAADCTEWKYHCHDRRDFLLNVKGRVGKNLVSC